MAQRIEIKDVTVSAGTAKATPASIPMVWREGYVEWIEMRWPRGPSGLVGIQILHSGTRVIPKADNNFLVTDDEILKWPIEGYPTAGVWSIAAYNTDVYDHTIQFRIGINEIGRQQLTSVPSTLPPIPAVSQGIGLEGIDLTPPSDLVEVPS
jgi:hypothetical protein